MRSTAELRAYSVSVGVLTVAAMIPLICKEGFGLETLPGSGPSNSGMNGCEQNAEYEVKDSACVRTERAKAYACGAQHYEGVNFLCRVDAFKAGYLKSLSEDPELAEFAKRVFG